MKELELAKKFLDEHKAEEIKEYDVRNINPFASYYLIATCPNERALDALSQELAEALEKNKISIRRIDGEPRSGWIVVDGEEVMIHLFLSYMRVEIDLDGLVDKRNSDLLSRGA